MTLVDRLRARARDERGASAVEFALIAIPFLTLVFGIIYFGIVFGQQLALGNGARQGARLGVVKASCSDIVREVQNGSATGESINVVASYTSAVPVPFFNPNINLGASGEFRCEYS